MSYTSGPWKVGKCAVDHNLLPILATDGNPPSEIAVVLPKPHSKATQKANAQLLASAPDLLEALWAALPYLVRLGDFIGNGEGATPMGRCDVIGRAKAAIAKATKGA